MRRKFSEALEMYDKAGNCSCLDDGFQLHLEALERVPDDLTYHNNKYLCRRQKRLLRKDKF